MEIERKLREAREASGLTQEQVAEKVMVSRQTISNWENGKSLPDIASIMNLSDLYHISLDELLKEDQRVKNKIENDENIANHNEKVILTTAIYAFILLIVHHLGTWLGIIINGIFRDISNGVIAGTLFVIALSCTATYMRIRKHKKV